MTSPKKTAKHALLLFLGGEVLHHLDDVLQSIHVVPVDDEVPQVPLRHVVGHVPEFVRDVAPSDVVQCLQAQLHDRDLDLGQHQQEVVVGLVELLRKGVSVLRILALDHQLEPGGQDLEVLEDFRQCVV